MNERPTFSPNCPLPETDGERIELAHGGGGLLTQRLIATIFRPAFAQSADDLTHDGALLDPAGTHLAFTTDGYVVRPLFFPGGDIGTLAVNGTVNDLAMCGARPLWLSAGFIIEEGFALRDLERIAQSMSAAARAAGVRLVTGDTKVVERGKGDGVYITTSGVGTVVAPAPITPRAVHPGDAILLSGDIGRHGMAVMAAREALGFEPPIQSDCAPIAAPVLALLEAGIELHCLRDLTRGGLATALIEIARDGNVMMQLDGAAIPVSTPVRGACEILGLDPLYVANEGRFVALLPADEAARALALLRRYDAAAAQIGTVEARGEPGGITLSTLGGSHALDLMTGEQLPRIC